MTRTRQLALAFFAVVAVLAAVVATSMMLRHRSYAAKAAVAEEFSRVLNDRFSGQEWVLVKEYLDKNGFSYRLPPSWGEDSPPTSTWELKVVTDLDAPSPVWFCGSVQVEVIVRFDREGRLASVHPTWSSRGCI